MTQSNEGLKVNLHQLLKAMIEKGASDMHITTGSPPLLRIDGSVVPLKLPPLSPVDSKALCYSILTEEQKVHFEKHNELDLSFGVKNLSRFRANVYMQRGAVSGAFRAIPFKILSFEELGLPPIIAELAYKPRGLDGLEVAHLADEDDVRILAQRVLERLLERVGVGADLALVDHAQLVRMQILDRIFDRQDVLAGLAVDLVDDRRERR